jgi:hypothetical protein
MEESIRIGIGGIGLCLQTRRPDVAQCLKEKYEAFHFSGPPEAVVTVVTDPRLKAASPEHMLVSESGARLEVRSPASRGVLDLETRKGSLVLASRNIENGSANFLRNCFQWLLLARGGFLLHSAGFLNDASAYLFFGSSGSGKTTLARQFVAARVLNDELVAVTVDETNVTAWGTPFWGDMQEGENINDGGRLKALVQLQHGDNCHLEALPPSKSLAELLHCIPLVTGQKREADRILEVALRVLKLVPCYTMHFEPNVSYLKEIHGSFGHISHEVR